MLYRVSCFMDTEIEADNEEEALEAAEEILRDEMVVEPYED